MEDLIINERKLREDLANLINSCNLPAVMVKPIVQELYNQICALEEQQYNEVVELKRKEQEKNKKKKGGE